ncbi:hypothetical protein SUDANB95_02980 [Actinosynnema sp. ALI-1.44]
MGEVGAGDRETTITTLEQANDRLRRLVSEAALTED